MQNESRVVLSEAEGAAKNMAVGSGDYRAAVEHLRSGLGAITRADSGGSMFNDMADQFSQAVLEAADHSAKAHTSAATGVAASIATTKAADDETRGAVTRSQA